MPSEAMAAASAAVAAAQRDLDHLSTQTGATISPSWWSVTDAMTMCAIVLAFGLLVTTVAAFLLYKGKSSTAVLRVFGTILILVLAVFLVVAAYDDRQLAPVLGLLGTVAGYLLGSREDRRAPLSQPQSDAGGQDPE